MECSSYVWISLFSSCLPSILFTGIDLVLCFMKQWYWWQGESNLQRPGKGFTGPNRVIHVRVTKRRSNFMQILFLYVVHQLASNLLKQKTNVAVFLFPL
jgi:hypothetical protein